MSKGTEFVVIALLGLLTGLTLRSALTLRDIKHELQSIHATLEAKR